MVVKKLARTSLYLSALLLAAAAPGQLACGAKKGGLMLAVTTDMLAPKDVNVVSVSIQVGPEIKYNFIGRVTPEGEVLLPATLAIVEPDDPNATIRVRVIAFQETKPRVLRDIITTSPRGGRLALLRMPLSFINDGSATGTLPAANLPAKSAASARTRQSGVRARGELEGRSPSNEDAIGTRTLRPSADPFNPYGADVVSTCTDPDQTVIDGECASARIDSSTLPDYVDELVFSSGPPGTCFASRTCFQGWREATVDDGCTAPKGGEVSNVTLVTNGTGDCNDKGLCFVPIDQSEDGWRDEGDRVRLSKGVCKKVREGTARLGFVSGAACPVKTPALPVCSGASSAPPNDGGVPPSEDGGSDAGGPLEQLVAASDVSGIAVYSDRLYYGSADGLFLVPTGRGNGTALGGSPGSTAEPWFVAQDGDKVVFAKGSLIDDSSDRIWLLPSAGATLLGVNVSSPVGGILRGATIGPDYMWFPVSNGGNGDVLKSDFSSQNTVMGLYSPIAATAAAFAQNNRMWVGRPSGAIDLCQPVDQPAFCDDSIATDSVTPVEGIGVIASLPTQAVLAKPDGVFLVNEVGGGPPDLAVSRIKTDDLEGVDINGHHFTRGIAMDTRCAYYASKSGIAFTTLNSSSSGLLVPKNPGTEVLGVAAPIFPGVPDRHVWFAVFGSAGTGGGVYRVKLPAACL
jgi:hypothetical protein